MDKSNTKYIIEVDHREIGNRIKNRRKSMGISQKDLAESIGITASYLSNIERGVSSASLDLIIILSVKLNVTPDFFILGVLKSSNVTSNIINSLKMCSDKEVRIISNLIMTFVKYKDEID